MGCEVQRLSEVSHWIYEGAIRIMFVIPSLAWIASFCFVCGLLDAVSTILGMHGVLISQQWRVLCMSPAEHGHAIDRLLSL